MFFFNDTATTEIYTLSLHDALPILTASRARSRQCIRAATAMRYLPLRPARRPAQPTRAARSEEHTSELQSHSDLVCRLLLVKKRRRCDCEFTISADGEIDG